MTCMLLFSYTRIRYFYDILVNVLLSGERWVTCFEGSHRHDI